ncbi:hypothetical protein OH76DRAFT_529411 [Lentinus brumalis]|uniref:Uncharacterized protein n=1 Tax=Lentinus brumalis TaxID=2498619 RepID=A0A371DA62_9APHY|nr:hypothetical protein OH76DRAFT_529411 [Polyporus brumalis]
MNLPQLLSNPVFVVELVGWAMAMVIAVGVPWRVRRDRSPVAHVDPDRPEGVSEETMSTGQPPVLEDACAVPQRPLVDVRGRQQSADAVVLGKVRATDATETVSELA